MRPLLSLLTLVALAGCAAPAAETSVDPLASKSAAETWRLEAEGAIGWVAAAGMHVYLGDLVVGIRSHDACPELSWPVPAGASALVIAVGAGTGPAQLAFDGPEGIAYVDTPAGEAHEERIEAPEPGVWLVELKPVGAAIAHTRDVTVTIEGAGSAPSPLVLKSDGDCIL